MHFRHDSFRNICVDFAQTIHRSEVQLRTYILGEPAKHIRPLSEVRYVLGPMGYNTWDSLHAHSAVENGANMLAEGFLFSVAASLIVGETWRSSRSESKRRENINDRLDDLEMTLAHLSTCLDNLSESVGSEMRRQDQRWASC